MAEEVQIQGSQEVGKVRNSLGVLGLTLITLGIYFFVWWFQVNKEMAALGQARGTNECGDNPSNSLLAMVPGFCVIVPPFLSFYNGSNRLNAASRLTGVPEGQDAGLMLVLYLFISPVAIYLFQEQLNKVLQAQAGGGQIQPGQAAAPTSAPEQPQPGQQQPPPQQ